MENEISFGAKVSPPDYRDIYIGQLGLPADVPQSYFVDISMLPVENQKKIGCCVGCAAAKYKQKLDYEDTNMVMPWSFRFLYTLAKCRDKVPGEGTYPRLVSDILTKTGCSEHNTCPNNTDLQHEEFVYHRIESEVPQSAKDEAYRAKTSGYAFVNKDIESIKQAIFHNQGLIMLVRVGKEWYTSPRGFSSWLPQDILPIRPPKEVISGHEIYVYGYSTERDGDLKIYFRNHWSERWADHGNGYFLYSQYKDYIDEMITFTDIPNTLLEEAHKQPVVFRYNFTKPMQLGQESEEVKQLQRALTQFGNYKYQITGYFGEITRKAVLDFQIKYISNLSIYERYVLRGAKVGQKTLEKLNFFTNR
jgi:hypothetical protein